MTRSRGAISSGPLRDWPQAPWWDCAGAREVAAQQLSFKPEPGAKLRVLRWKRFVQGDEDAWAANGRSSPRQPAFRSSWKSENWKTCGESCGCPNVGSGPDIIIGTNDDPHHTRPSCWM